MPFFSSIGTTFNIFAIGLLLPFLSHILGFNDLFIVVLSFCSIFLGNLTILLANIPNLMYLASLFRMLADTTTICIRCGNLALI